MALLLDAEKFEDLFFATSLHLHPLVGNRRGQYSMTLQGRWRMIVTLNADTVTVEEVSNHHGD